MTIASRVCFNVSVIDAPRTGVKYAAAFQKALDDWNIPLSAVAVGLSDHEGAIRKGPLLRIV